MRKRTILLAISLLINASVFSQTVIKMQKEGGVYTVPCTVNGLKLRFIFDTGASDVSISLTEVGFMLKNGYLDANDIKGKQNYVDAKGEISVGTVINLRKLEIAGIKLYDVSASVVHELYAPLLLGQSAMAKLGKFQFDPVNETLTLLSNSNNTYNYESKSSYNKSNSITYTQYSGKVKIKSNSPINLEPEAGSKVLGYANDYVEIISKHNNSFYLIDYKGLRGYIFTNLIIP